MLFIYIFDNTHSCYLVSRLYEDGNSDTNRSSNLDAAYTLTENTKTKTLKQNRLDALCYLNKSHDFH